MPTSEPDVGSGVEAERHEAPVGAPGPEASANVLQLVTEASHEPFADVWSRLQARLQDQVLEPLRGGAERHRESIASVGLGGGPPDDWRVRSDKLLEYRRTVGAALLEPMVAVFEHRGPASIIGEVVAGALEESVTRCAALPEEVPSRWEEGALARHPADSRRRRIGKLLARVVSPARKAGRDRLLPLRIVARDHLARVVAPGQDRVLVQGMAHWAAWAGRLEQALLEWADTALPALIRAELPEKEDATELWTAVHEAAEDLQTRLEGLLEDEPLTEAAAAAKSRLDAEVGRLAADLAVAGSFLLGGVDGPPETPPSLRRVEGASEAMQAWDRDVAARMQLYLSILGILSGATAVQRRLVYRCRERSLSRAGDLIEVADQLTGLVESLRQPEAGLRARLAALDSQVSRSLEPAFTAVPSSSEVQTTVNEVTESTVEALLAMIRQAPATLVLHAPDESPPSGAKAAEARPLPLQELARQSFDALRIERIRASTAGFVAIVDDVREDLSGLPDVFSFARNEALRELEAGEQGAEARAVDFVAGALQRMARSLQTRVGELEDAVDDAQQRLAEEISEGSTALLERVSAGRMQAQLFAARSQVADLIVRVGERWGPPVRRVLGSVVAWLRRAWVVLAGVLRKGSAALGREPTAEAESARAIQTLAGVERLVEGLPLVYQRLFTLEPISDPALLAGREAPLEAAMGHWRRWRSDEGVPLVVRGRQRSGITSFLNVLAGRIEADSGKVARLTFTRRVEDDADLCKLLADVPGLPNCTTLDEVARAIFDVDEATLPAAIAIDNLEHVYLRVPRGTDLVERLLTLMAETEPRIFWIAGVSSSAWQLIRTAEPSAVSQMDLLDLPSLGAQAMQDAILARHRRSGLDVHYEEPTTLKARLKRRLRRGRDREGYHDALEDDFFQQLFRASGGYLGLALFQWLSAADFESGSGVLMRQPERPDFSLLDQLSLTQNFTLKAFLEHRTLTLEEHDRIFRLPRHESYQIFESLRNRQLIEAVVEGRGQGRAERSEIEVGFRYRVRPLLTGPLISHLQGRNIIH